TVVATTASPSPMQSEASETCMAEVAELTDKAAGAPTYCANSDSNWLVLGPVVSQPPRRVRTTSSISSSPIKGGAKGRNSDRITPPSAEALANGCAAGASARAPGRQTA